MDEQCRSDIRIKYVSSTRAPSADVDSWTACVAGASLSSIDPGVVVEADPQLASAIVDSRTKQLETATAPKNQMTMTTTISATMLSFIQRYRLPRTHGLTNLWVTLVIRRSTNWIVRSRLINHRSTSWIDKLRSLKRPGYGSHCLHCARERTPPQRLAFCLLGKSADLHRRLALCSPVPATVNGLKVAKVRSASGSLRRRASATTAQILIVTSTVAKFAMQP